MDVAAAEMSSKQSTKTTAAQALAEPSDGLEPSTPVLTMFQDVTRVHARSLASYFLLRIGRSCGQEMRREASGVSFLMCPFCVRAPLLTLTTERAVSPRSAV